MSLDMNKSDHQTMMVNTILTQTNEIETTMLSSQFILNELNKNKYKKMHASTPLTDNQLSVLYSKISAGIIDVSKSIPSTEASSEKEATNKIRTSAKAKQIIEDKNREKQAKELNNIIKQMGENENDILTGDNPTITLLEGIIQYYTIPTANKIIKIIVLRSLIRRYSESGNENLVPFIFEMRNEILEFKSEWFEQIIHVDTTVVAEIATSTTSGRINHRKARMQKAIASTVVEQFDYPTNTELALNELSERIKVATRNYYLEANTILQRVDINPIKYQMVESYWRLKPLSSWDKTIKKLDDWQKLAIRMIDENKCILITAPTSSGKTVIAQYCAIRDLKTDKKTKVLFVVPNSILAVQVAGTFCNGGIKVGLYTNEEEYGKIDSVNVIVATPSKAEELMCTNRCELTYAVFDEIQQINGFEGESIERLIKTINCPFLVLSATVHKPEHFCDFLSKVSGNEVQLIQYNKRFIVQQKHVWNGDNLITLHPLNCIDVDYIINDQFKSGDLAMTARDVYVMGCDMAKFFDRSEFSNFEPQIHPERYFNQDTAINISMVEQYEQYLKNFLVQFAQTDRDLVSMYLQRYNLDNTEWNSTELETALPVRQIINMFKTLKSKQLLPALCFMMNNFAVFDVYKSIVTTMENIEAYYFPWYHNFMEKMHELVQNFVDNEEVLKESIAKGIVGRGNKQKQIQDSLNQSRKSLILNFLGQIEARYESEKFKAMENSVLSENEKTMIVNFLNQDYISKYRTHYTNQINAMVVKTPKFNPFAPTSLFSFHKTPLSVDTMRHIKSGLKKFARQTAGANVSQDISYDNIYIRGIERGIVLYSANMSASFQRIIQELIVNNQAPVCIADDSLAYGVNFPTRTVVMLGLTSNETINVSKGTQMAGRSGRRGYDTQGHIVYCRVNYQNIMRGTFVPFVGKDTITPFTLLPGKIFDDAQYILNVLKKPLQLFDSPEDYQIQPILDQFVEMYHEDDIFQQDGIMSLLLWYYRDEPDIAYNILTLVNYLIDYIPHAHIELEIISTNTSGKKDKKINNNDDDDVEQYDVNESGNKINFKMETTKLNQLIELLFRVFDYEPLEDTIVTNVMPSKIPDIMSSELWASPLNTTNCGFIECIIIRSTGLYTGNDTMIEKLVRRTQHVILCAIKLYNLFVEIGNFNLIKVLNPVISSIKSFNDKLKLINQ